MNPLNTIEKAKKWAHNRAKLFSVNGKLVSFVVCSWNDGYIVHPTSHIIRFQSEYSSDEIIYCTDEDDFLKIMVLLRLIK